MKVLELKERISEGIKNKASKKMKEGIEVLAAQFPDDSNKLRYIQAVYGLDFLASYLSHYAPEYSYSPSDFIEHLL